MQRLSDRCFKHITPIICTIGEDQFLLGTLNIDLIYRKSKHPEDGDIHLLTPKSKRKMYNKISGTFGVKVIHINVSNEISKTEYGVFAIPRYCIMITNLKAERRNKLRVLLAE